MHSKNKIKSRIFIVGAARSGTTLLQSMLSSHPEMYSFPETHFFSGTIPIARWKRFFALFGAKKHHYVKKYLDRVGATHLAGQLPKITVSHRRWAEGLITILDELALEKNYERWIEKTPMHLYYVDLIALIEPEVQFVHIIRNGEDVVASLYEVSHKKPEYFGGPRTIQQCISRWKHDISISHKYIRNPHHHILSYEQLVASPEKILRILCTRLDLPFDPTMLDYKGTVKNLRFPEEAWKSKNTEELQRTSKFESIFSTQEQSYITKALKNIDISFLQTYS